MLAALYRNLIFSIANIKRFFLLYKCFFFFLPRDKIFAVIVIVFLILVNTIPK